MTTEIFQYGRYCCIYQLVRESRKTVRLSVRPDQLVVLRCPEEASLDQVNRFLRRKWVWIKKQKQYFSQFCGIPTTKEYVSGTSFLYLGRQYQLIVCDALEDSAVIGRGKITVFINSRANQERRVERILIHWYLTKSKSIFQERLAEMLLRFDLKIIPHLVIKKMQKRWGSFVRGKTIILNPRLIQASKDCIDYVIAHELCHYTYKRHDKNFYKLLSNKFRGWEKIKAKLEFRLGTSIVYIPGGIFSE